MKFSDEPEVIILSDKAFDKLTELIEDEKPNPALIELMQRPKPWVDSKGDS